LHKPFWLSGFLFMLLHRALLDVHVPGCFMPMQ
jgi:hypothetical protein